MGRIALTKIVLRNFRSFLGEHTIHLPSSGLVILQGRNLDSGGESGAGKSAVLHAIAYAFGFAPYSAKALQNWDTEEPMSVEVHMETGNTGFAVLTRGIGQLSLHVDYGVGVGADTHRGAAKFVEAKLDELCGINSALRAALTYRGQKRPGLFLAMTDAEKKEFFVDVLKLHWAEEAIEKAAKSITAMEKDETAAVAKVATAEGIWAHQAAQVKPYTPRDTSELENTIRCMEADEVTMARWVAEKEEAWKRAVQEEKALALAAQTDVEPRVRELEAEIRRVQSASFSWDNSERNKLEAQAVECRQRQRSDEEKLAEERRQLQMQLASAKKSEREGEQAKVSKLVAEAELASLREERCPTCEQQVPDTSALIAATIEKIEDADYYVRWGISAAATRLRVEAEAVEHELRSKAHLQRYDAVWTHLREQAGEEQKRAAVAKAVHDSNVKGAVTKLQLEISKLRAEAATASVAAAQDDNRQSVRLMRLGRELMNDHFNHQTALHGKKSELKRLQQEDAQAFLAHQSAVQNECVLEGRLNDARWELDQVRTHLNAERDFHAMVKGFLNAIFDEILAEITDETNATLGSLPNVAHMTIRFVSDYQTAKGTTKQSIVPIASFNGDEHPLQSGCSGGMETSVELAVDLAVARVVSRRTGSDLGWLILDESFTGHDQVTKESCLEVLQKFADDRLVLIVDHGAEAKEMFTQRIQIDYRNGRSELAKEEP